MLKPPHTYPFYALLLNNGNANGFKPLEAWSSNAIQTKLLSDAVTQNEIVLLGYDLKNHFEALSSKNETGYSFPDYLRICPEHFAFLNPNAIPNIAEFDAHKIPTELTIQQKVSKQTYIEHVLSLKQHIQQGNIYEINYCIEFFAQNVSLDAFELFKKYNSIAMAPMSAYVKINNLHIICGSPERFLRKNDSTLISQPIKGTRKRDTNDALMIEELRNDKKERAENVMIVDLVRNDLAKIANRNSVHVDELCEIYTFKTVHQSISTVRCTIPHTMPLHHILNATFPMGSMTGAPKISAMQLIDEAENSKRAIYSGSIGYLTPNHDFDLNVVIRSIVYDAEKGYLSFMVGSAITANCDPEKEYDECLIKAGAMLNALNARLV